MKKAKINQTRRLSAAEEEKLKYLCEHLLIYGNTVLNEEPNKYLSLLDNLGFSCVYREVEPKVIDSNWQSNTRRGVILSSFYVIELCR